MLTTATSQVARLASRVARRIDASLVEHAARNAEASMQAEHLRRLDEMRTLDDLYALEGLPPQPHVAAAAPAELRWRELASAAAG